MLVKVSLGLCKMSVKFSMQLVSLWVDKDQKRKVKSFVDQESTPFWDSFQDPEGIVCMPICFIWVLEFGIFISCRS